ncbi:ATP-dependent Clp protease ATP-binding subunit [Candidatus Dojkabacteria bacterium]|uniref:ATP-dependent Clp protease ATP-binding subunit n=1 Tax=Candidatus Dojkabacteria bacterium TaxID=2099670 RepID=A0A955L9V8_9BACT|nr:ATP-dependent Clp protease ATP-binding subunit [Candidatus Dojkabacteria bacterium]
MDLSSPKNNAIGFDRLTDNARKVINQGYSIAKGYMHNEFLVIHVFLALLENKKGVVDELFNKLGIDDKATIGRIRNELANLTSLPESKPGTIPSFSAQIKELINEAYLTSVELGQVFVGTEHLFLAMFRTNGLKFVEDMKRVGIDFETLKNSITSLGNYSMLDSNDSFDEDSDPTLNPDELPFFVRDMNQIAEEGKFPKITGRDEEVQRLIHILSRKTKNNPILVGDAGVGKTAIVEGFVNRLVAGDLPASLIQKRVLNVDVASIIAGAKLRGDVEERISYLINRAIEDGNVIIFIDEIHNIVGAGSVGGKDTLDVANILKPYLTSSELTVIGATTTDEYNKYFEEDSALSRRFQPVFIDELDVESTKKILTTMKKEFEDYHKVKINSDAIKEAVELSDKFIKDRYLPDKAIDLIDEAAASVKIGREVAIEPELSKLGAKLIEAQEKKEKAVKNKKMDSAMKFKLQEEKITDQIENLIEGRKAVKQKYKKTVNADLIKQTVVDWTKIPIAASDISNKKLANLANKLKERVIGQDHIVDNLALAIQRSHLGLGEGKRPLGSFLFLGPTGVGKTELAKSLAKELFGSEDLLVQIDMSEMMEMHSVSKLIGSPPGYVGHDEGGQLTKYVKRKPYSVVLFDEIEKAHPDTLNLLLQILDEGQITDAKGAKVSFSNTVIMMTSNIGVEDVAPGGKIGFDFAFDEDKPEADKSYTDMKDTITDRLRKTLRPEFINRVDLIDVFRSLTKEDCLEITKIQVNDLVLRLLNKEIVLDVSTELVNYINEQGYSKEFGGRNIRRKVIEILENGLAQYLLDQDIPAKRKKMIKIKADYNKEKVVFKK